jgi:L-fuconolactonase
MKYTFQFLSLTIALVTFQSVAFAAKPWIIDPHTHFKGATQIEYERERVERVPQDSLGRVVTAEDYRDVAERLEIRSTLVIEACDQDKPEFNDWVLNEAQSELICGYVARGDLTDPAFPQHFQRYYNTGYLNGFRFRFDELRGYLDNELAQKHLRLLANHGMVIDLLIEASHADDVSALANAYPRLRIVINHCFRAKIIDSDISMELKSAIIQCARHPNVYCKISSINNFSEVLPFTVAAPTELEYYLPILNPVYDAFGPSRVIFATNWGVSAHFGTVDNVKKIIMEFLEPKGQLVMNKAMYRNAMRVYNIRRRYLR